MYRATSFLVVVVEFRCSDNSESDSTNEKTKMIKTLSAAFLALALTTTVAFPQALSLEELAAKVDERSQTLGGYEDFLMDPDPKRAMAALQVMLESGDDTLVQMALSHGLTSPDFAIRQTALKAYFAGKPNLAISVTAAGLAEDEKTLSAMDSMFRALNGSWGANGTGSLSLKVGEWSEELGCNVRGDAAEICATRTSATSVSIYISSSNQSVPSQWVQMTPNDKGYLEGSFIGSTSVPGTSRIFKSPSLKAAIKLTE